MVIQDSPSTQLPFAPVWAENGVVAIDLGDAIRAIKVLNIQHMRERFRKEVAALGQQVWMNAVKGRSLPGMTYDVHDPAYAQAIANHNAVQITSDGVVLAPSYERAQEYEDGIEPYDMKPGFLANATKESKDGDRYRVVPFRHGTPGQSGEGVGFATIMPEEVYDVARTLEDGEEIVQDGGEITKPQLATMSAPYTHTASLYQGMRKYGKKGASRYMTFRTVSEASGTNSWHHPGKPANPIVEAVGQEIETRIIPEIMARLIGNK